MKRAQGQLESLTVRIADLEQLKGTLKGSTVAPAASLLLQPYCNRTATPTDPPDAPETRRV